MDEHELRESLRRLPDARPGAAFTAEVLARVERWELQRSAGAAGVRTNRPRGAAARWRPTLLAAGLAAALIAAVGLWQPLAGGRGSGVGGDRIEEPEATTTERLGEEGRGGRARAGEVATAGAVRTGGRAEEAAGEGLAGTGRDPATAVEDTRRTAAATPGAGGRPSSRAGSSSPERRGAPGLPLADGVSAATETGGPVGERRVASAVGSVDDLPPSGSPAEDRAAAPSTADADFPGSDFFDSPPARGFDPPVALPAAQRLARLRAEREALERRLVAFRRELPPAEPPVVLLGGDEGLELVFDLGRWAASPAGETAGAVRPAVHSTQDPPRRF